MPHIADISVRPHSEAELRADTASAWVCPSYDLRMIKLAKPREGARETKEWYFGELRSASFADHRPHSCTRHRQCKDVCDISSSACAMYVKLGYADDSRNGWL